VVEIESRKLNLSLSSGLPRTRNSVWIGGTGICSGEDLSLYYVRRWNGEIAISFIFKSLIACGGSGRVTGSTVGSDVKQCC
jgi:hypothetical protein